MKFHIFILLIILGVEVSADDISINSVVYDLKITDENGIGGFCLINLDPKTAQALEKENWIDAIEHNPWEMEVFMISEEENAHKIVFKIKNSSGTIYDHDLKILLPAFPYRVEKTLLVVSTRKKFVWKVDSSFYSLTNDDSFLVDDDMETNAINELDGELKNLKRILEIDHPPNLAENRIYLGEINVKEEVVINAWSGKGYEYYLPYVFGAVILCIILFTTFYLISKRV